MAEWLETWGSLVASLLAGGTALVAVSHAILNKRETRAAAAWAALILLLPGFGAALYLLLGINRVRRAGGRARSGMQRYDHPSTAALSAEALAARLEPADAHLSGIARTVERTSRWPLLPGNHVTILRDGDAAYAEMLDCIESATTSVALSTYIFDNDAAGQRFTAALGAACARGVDVRVLIDDAGARYSLPAIDRLLRARGVPVARFMKVWAPWSAAFANLRNHRKILVVDGVIGFTGGMNIRASMLAQGGSAAATRDLHFRLDGPVVTQLMSVFGEDWTFATREVLPDERWFPEPRPYGQSVARAIVGGPDRDLDCLRWALHGALSSARRSVRVVTPYFLPDEPLITALNVAALRGVQVDIVLPERGNLRVMRWAMRGELWKVLHHGCRVWLTPAPFDHAKLMTVDGAWTLFGSANWDPRSLRLNFELGVECYDRALVAALDELIDRRIERARRFDAAAHAAIPFALRLRDAAARLLSPYL